MFKNTSQGIHQMSDSITSAITEHSRDQAHTYVLMTAAHNEEATIEGTIKSIVSQTVPPERWVIVSDGSTDKTDDIIQEYARRLGFIRYLRITRPPGRNFGSKVLALHHGCKLLEECQFAFIGNVDADVSLEPTYFQDLLEHFDRRPTLGLAGGFFFEEEDGEFKSRRGNRTFAVTHAAQLVRRECYEAIGGYAVLEYGGEDWHAETSARMNGWEIEAFPNLKIFHHRHTGEAENLLRYKFRQGKMDYSFGSAFSFELLKCLLRVSEKPFFLGCAARLTGFFYSWMRREKRPVSDEFITFLRGEQRARVASLLRGGDVLGRERTKSQS
jgi:poly-beta-1,6-N-acetyl-D-glucosamine synthase